MSRAPTVLVEQSSALPLIGLTIALRSGATLDPEGREGLCRLTGRMMRRTGGGRSTEELDRRIDSLGGSLVVDSSHSTTGVHGAVIARSLEPFVELMEDVTAHPGFDEEELQRLIRETQAELVEALDHDRSLARHWFRRSMYAGHDYARSVSGNHASVAATTRDEVVRFHRQSFVRDNLIFAFSGDIDPESARSVAERIAGALPDAEAPDVAVSAPSFAQGRRLVFVDKPERSQTQILIGTAGTHPRDPDHIALFVANTVFGGTFTARLSHEVREKRGWSYGAYSSLPIDRERRAMSLWTFPKAEDAAACIRLELDLLERFVARGVTQKELTLAKRYLIRSHAFALDTASKRVNLELDRLLYDLPEDYYSAYTERVNAVSRDDVNAAIARRLDPKDLLVVVVGTASDIADAVRSAIPNLETSEVVAYDSDA